MKCLISIYILIILNAKFAPSFGIGSQLRYYLDRYYLVRHYYGLPVIYQDHVLTK